MESRIAQSVYRAARMLWPRKDAAGRSGETPKSFENNNALKIFTYDLHTVRRALVMVDHRLQIQASSDMEARDILASMLGGERVPTGVISIIAPEIGASRSAETVADLHFAISYSDQIPGLEGSVSLKRVG